MKKFIKVLGMTAFVLTVLAFAGCSSPSSDSDCPLVNELNDKSGGTVSGMPNKGDFFALVFDELKDNMTKFKDIQSAMINGDVVAGGPLLTEDSFYLTEYDGIIPTATVWEGSGEHYMMITQVDEASSSQNMVMNIINRVESIGGSGNLYYLSKNKITFTDGKCTAAFTDFQLLVDVEEQILPRYIDEDTTLGANNKNYYFDLGVPIEVRSPATLRVLPGVSIRFTHQYGGIKINNGAMLKMEGTADARIKLYGAGTGKGSWSGIQFGDHARSDNVMNYVDILNAGSGTDARHGAVLLTNGNLTMTNCIIDGSGKNGIVVTTSGGGNIDVGIAEFRGNIIRNCNLAPVYSRVTPYFLRTISNDNPFNEWTGNNSAGNGNNYIHVAMGITLYNSMTLPRLCNPNDTTKTTIPWYFQDGFTVGSVDYNPQVVFTVEAGADLMIGASSSIVINRPAIFIANGTEQARIKIREFSPLGPWRHIYYDSRDNRGLIFNYCDISGGGHENGGLIYLITAEWGVRPAYLEINNTTLKDSKSYGLRLEHRAGNACRIISSNPSSVVFENCMEGNIYANNTPPAYNTWVKYDTLSAYGLYTP